MIVASAEMIWIGAAAYLAAGVRRNRAARPRDQRRRSFLPPSHPSRRGAALAAPAADVDRRRRREPEGRRVKRPHRRLHLVIWLLIAPAVAAGLALALRHLPAETRTDIPAAAITGEDR
jgi:hypothetical protein